MNIINILIRSKVMACIKMYLNLLHFLWIITAWFIDRVHLACDSSDYLEIKY